MQKMKTVHKLNPTFVGHALEFAEKYGGTTDPLAIFLRDDYSPLSSKGLKQIWSEHLCEAHERGAVEPVNLYLHFPFCIAKCRYCLYFSRPLASRSETKLYTDFLMDSLRYHADLPVRHPVRNIYLGGGTPTLFSEKQLRQVLTVLFDNYDIHGPGEKSCECSPVTVTPEQLQLLKEFGFNRISMGVQTFNRKALRLSERDYQKKNRVARAISDIISMGFDRGLNVDMILGLEGESLKSFEDSLDAILAMAPDMVTVYRLLSTRSYLSEFHQGDTREFMRRLEEKVSGAIDMMAGKAARFGYSLSTLSPHATAWTFLTRKERRGSVSTDVSEADIYDDIPLVPSSLFGIGPSSRCNVLGRLVYSATKEIQTQFNPDAEIYQAKTVSMIYEMARFVIISFRKKMECDLKRFKKLFGVELPDVFGAAFSALEATGRAEIEAGKLKLTPVSAENILFTAMLFRGSISSARQST